ncbi:3-phenylpropionate/trans-cinnamate dioxygenase ferredoxin reductase subunit [Variibacter gotjawalensis]|nr:3-phenylpropionate/trans-cinnamate dioxygenase ferredoxin reductase subunit [Variibacter gotjawalensis]
MRDEKFDGRIVLVGDEPELPYQRPPLSKAYMNRTMLDSGIYLRPDTFFAQHNIELMTGAMVTRVDRVAKQIALGSGGRLDYDHLVLATGARNRLLPVPGNELDGVVYLRSLADARSVRERIDMVQNIVVVGAGFIGLEFAAVAAKRGKKVTVIESTERAMGRAISREISDFFQDAHRAWGTELLFGTTLKRIDGDDHVSEVETSDGRVIPADLVAVGIGVVPNTELASDAGLRVANGIVVDTQLSTADAAISAVGDCVNFPSHFAGASVRLESVQNAVDQGKAIAARLMGKSISYNAVPWFWSDQGDLKLQMVGLTAGHDQTVVRGDPAERAFSVFCFQGGKLLGIETVNRASDHVMGRRLLAQPTSLSPDEVAAENFDLKAYVMASANR